MANNDISGDATGSADTWTVQFLRRARALIETGWTKGAASVTAEDGTVSYCMVGALAAAEEQLIKEQLLRADHTAEARIAYRRLIEVTRTTPGYLSRFNDAAPSRAFVLEAFDKAIALDK